MSPACLAEMSPDAPTSSRKQEENKAIIDRWFTGFWGKNYDPAIVDEIYQLGEQSITRIV
jgi:hypothetical protein